MGCLLLYRLGPAEFGLRVDEFLRAQRASALLALVTIGIRITALRACTHNVAVCKKLFGLRIIVLLGLLCDELSFIVQLAEKFGSVPLVNRRGCTAIDVEVDSQTRERILDDLVVTVHDILRGTALHAGLDRDRDSVLIASADIKHILSPHPEVPDVDVRRHVYPGQMTDVDRSVGIRQRTGHKCSLEFLFHIHEYYFSLPNLTFTILSAFCTLSISCIISSTRSSSEAACASPSLSFSSFSLSSKRLC